MDPDLTVSASDLAHLWEVTPARIYQLTQEGVLHRVGRGKYPLFASVWALRRHEFGANENGKGAGESPRLRRERAEAERAEHRAAREREELLPATAHREIVYDLVGRLQSRILKIPSAWSVDVLGIKNRREALVRLRPLVAQLVETLQVVGDEVEEEESPPRRRRARRS